jgi:hypothetical protein
MTTKVFYAGKPPGSFTDVVSIFTNPDNEAGSNVPLLQPFNNLDRVCFDTRISYFNIVQTFNFTKPFGEISVNSNPDLVKKGKTGINVPVENDTLTFLTPHNLGYVPAGILIDRDTRESICGHHMLQNVNNNSFRVISLYADNTFFYLKEKSYVRLDTIPSLTRRYTLIIFSESASVLEIPSG